MVVHIDQASHLPRWDGAKILEMCMSKGQRKALEAAHILMGGTVNTRTGFITLAKGTAKIALNER